MDPKTFTYDICRCYVDDNAGLLEPHEIDLIRGWIRSRSLEKLAACSDLIPNALSSRDRFRFLMQVEAFFKKNASFAMPSICREAASKAFFEAEEVCRTTNQRLELFFLEHGSENPDLEMKISKMVSFIDRVLGDFRVFLDEMPRYLRVTSGATATHSRKRSLPYLKVSKIQSCTVAARPFLSALSEYFGYGRLKFRNTYWNRVHYVPKNWKTERTIACEPSGNIPLQLAFDKFAKGRLRAIGIDLSDQSRNQAYAKQGSIHGNFATIDISQASDTVAFNTIALLFPYEWFQYLTACRTAFGKVPGSDELLRYEKFSSMGNGSTFTIETLVFAAACKAVGSKEFCVYGDDIIIETEYAEELKALLAFFGMKVNPDKSHITGPFRESCGTNWYQGIDITPFYLRSVVNSKAVLCHISNNLMKLTYPGGALERLCTKLVLTEKLPLVPFNLSSTSGIWVDIPSAYSKKLLRVRYSMARFKALCPISNYRDTPDSRSLFLWFLDKLKGEGQRINPLDFAPFIKEWDLISEDSQQRSRTPIFGHKYVRKWVYWHPPVVAAPDHLYWWSEILLARKG